MEVRYDLKGTITAYIKIDKRLGESLNKNALKTLLKIRIKDAERMPGETKLTMELVNEITITDKLGAK